MRHPTTDDKIVTRLEADGHWTYLSVRDERDNGTIIDFLQSRGALTLGRVREELRTWSGQERPAPSRADLRSSVEVERVELRHLSYFVAVDPNGRRTGFVLYTPLQTGLRTQAAKIVIAALRLATFRQVRGNGLSGKCSRLRGRARRALRAERYRELYLKSDDRHSPT
jgi:hypothetical protein